MKTSDNQVANEVTAAVRAGAESVEAAKRITTVAVLGVQVPFVALDAGVKVATDALATAKEMLPGPIRRQLHISLTEVDSFIAYVKRYRQESDSVIYADTPNLRLVCVFDDHEKLTRSEATEANGWREHRATYACPLSPEWLRWSKAANTKMSQSAFGDFVDSNLLDLTSGEDYPAPGEVLQMARSLQVNVGSKYKRVINPTTGEGTLISENEHTEASTKIPRAFALGLRVFEGGEKHLVETRLRLSMENGIPAFSFELYRADEHIRDAFGEVRVAVEQATELPLYAGAPA